MMNTHRIRVRTMIVDEHVSSRQLLGLALARDLGCEICGQASSGLEALKLCELNRPQLLITEICLRELNGIELLQRVRETSPNIRTLIYSGVDDWDCVRRALTARPHAFVGKSDPWSVLQDAVSAVIQGRSYFNKLATDVLNDPVGPVNGNNGCGHSTFGDGRTQPISRRETEVLQMVAEGLRSKEIAARLDVAIKTVENHRANLMQKLHVHDIASLTRYAMRHGIVIAHKNGDVM